MATFVIDQQAQELLRNTGLREDQSIYMAPEVSPINSRIMTPSLEVAQAIEGLLKQHSPGAKDFRIENEDGGYRVYGPTQAFEAARNAVTGKGMGEKN